TSEGPPMRPTSMRPTSMRPTPMRLTPMRLTLVARPPSDRNLRLLKQLGVDEAVHYDMADLPEDPAALAAIRARYAAFGLRWTVAESGPALDRIVLGKAGWREQAERYARIVGRLGDLGVEVVAYNFMP